MVRYSYWREHPGEYHRRKVSSNSFTGCPEIEVLKKDANNYFYPELRKLTFELLFLGVLEQQN